MSGGIQCQLQLIVIEIDQL